MQDLLSMITRLQRPRLLVRAARFGLDDYDRAQRLPRLLGQPVAPGTGEAVMMLLEIEDEHDRARRNTSPDYSVARHVEVLIALMGEARALRHMRPAHRSDVVPFVR
jgi:hypothetical protein